MPWMRRKHERGPSTAGLLAHSHPTVVTIESVAVLDRSVRRARSAMQANRFLRGRSERNTTTMYGMINKSIEALITSRYGPAVWEKILDEAGIGRPDYVLMRSYDDDETYKIVGAATIILGVPAEDILEAFGEYWVSYAEVGYGELLRFTGENFLDFVMHLDEMHARIKLAFPELRPPSFSTIPNQDGSMWIHYRSERPGLQPVVRGVLNGLAKRMGITLVITQSEDPDDGHAVFHVVPSGRGSWLPVASNS